jgi:virginiamycin B lyase
MLAFGVKGEVFKYDVTNSTITVYGLPAKLTSPVGIVLDEDGNPWITDHGTSIFFMLNATDGQITEFPTSPFSTRISPGLVSYENAYTLPYWIRSDSNNSLWFNEHTGNKIGRFDPKNNVLTEYWIPTQNPLWGMCDPRTTTAVCGIANALQFSIGKNNELWFSEWTENKLGMLNTSSPIPFKVKIAEEMVQVKNGQTKEITITISSDKDVNVRMIASSTLTPTGGFGNSTVSFSQDSIQVKPGEEKKVSFLITPSQDTPAGDYTMMIGVEDDRVSHMKAIRLEIT